jgi:peptidoglycan/xylan/chitin deacetylase (PgdA/CDA1 family)
MRVPGAKLMRHSVHWLLSRFQPGALILGYHSISDARSDPHSLHVPISHFVEQLEVLCRRARPMQLHQLLTGLYSRNLPKRAVAITFDDGYADMLHLVLPLLERFEVPATVFVTTGYLGREFWWHELDRLLLRWAAAPQPLPKWVSTGVKHNHERIYRCYYDHVAGLGPEEREAALAQLRTWAGADPNQAPVYRCLDAREVTQLAQSDLITVGAHSVTHPMLAAQPIEQQRWEIQESRAHLQALTTRSVTFFSYPHGSASAASRRLLAEADFVGACGSSGTVASSGSDPFELPRYWVPNWDGDKFGQWLDRWLCR